MAIVFAKVPILAVWTKQSSVTFGARSSDPILMQVDALVAAFPDPVGMPPAEKRALQTMALARLYYAVDLWLKEAAKGKGASGRKEAMEALYLCVCKALTMATAVPVNMLPDWLKITFGRGLNEHGVEIDFKDKSAQYLSAPEVDLYRLQFKSGVAYQMQWWLAKGRLVAAESSHSIPVGKAMQDGHSGYVMSMGGDFFMGPHSTVGGKKDNFYHSSYMAG
ncbi:hypothetical protein [Glacieibacterium sp.]|uniref:hypothetical protein n=1 Tax=Glacieibacterium sp. TaxID=2860237 RepID=UPI003B0063A6